MSLQVADQIYKERLRDWINEERRKLADRQQLVGKDMASMAALATAWNEILTSAGLPSITESQIGKWKRMTIIERITDDVLIRIAKLRGESLDATKAWLEEGMEALKDDSVPLSQLVLERPLPEVAQALSAIVRRLERHMRLGKLLVCIPEENFPRFQQLLFAEQFRQDCMNRDDDFAQYLDIEPERLRELKQGKIAWGDASLTAEHLATKIADESGEYGNSDLILELFGLD